MSQEEKKNLRREIKTAIEHLDEDYCQRADKIIESRVLASKNYIDSKTVFCFVGVGGEPKTKGIIETALREGKRVCVPLCIDEGIMKAIEITDFERDLFLGKYGILEPKDCGEKTVTASDIDFGIIPCVTCDHEGNRLGHGKGYYDRFLSQAKFPTVMICYEKLVRNDIPLEPFDRKADEVITDV